MTFADDGDCERGVDEDAALRGGPLVQADFAGGWDAGILTVDAVAGLLILRDAHIKDQWKRNVHLRTE